jgi:ABC-2 type transport system ATP-binding protein
MPGLNEAMTPSDQKPTATAPAVRVSTIAKRFGTTEAISDVSFEISPGSICGLVGSDGAGKTTLLRIIATMLAPDEGFIEVLGNDVVKARAAVKKCLGYMPQRFGLYNDLTVGENFDFFMDIYNVSGPERQKRRQRYLGFSNLLPFIDRRAGNLSGGMKQKLGLACVLVHQPKVLILDEPTNGVDPVSRREFWDILSQMRQSGMTILVATSYLDEGEKCDRLLLMHSARLLANASPAELRGENADLEATMVHRIAAMGSDEGALGFA